MVTAPDLYCETSCPLDVLHITTSVDSDNDTVAVSLMEKRTLDGWTIGCMPLLVEDGNASY